MRITDKSATREIHHLFGYGVSECVENVFAMIVAVNAGMEAEICGRAVGSDDEEMAGGFPDWINLGSEMSNAATDFLFGFRVDGDEVTEENVISAGDDLIDGITLHYGSGVIFGVGFGLECIGADLNRNVHCCSPTLNTPVKVVAGGAASPGGETINPRQ
jgi:hypothetical protein